MGQSASAFDTFWDEEREWSPAHGNGILTTDGRVMFQGGPDGVTTIGRKTSPAACRSRSRAGVLRRAVLMLFTLASVDRFGRRLIW